MKPSCALVTLTIGERFANAFAREMRPRWQEYCGRHGLGLEVIDRVLDESPRAGARSPAWQKLIVHRSGRVAGYDRIAWVDADVAIRPDGPNLFDQVGEEFVGAVDDFATPDKYEHRAMLERLYRLWDRAGIRYHHNLEPREYYAHYGIDCGLTEVVQTGVMVYSPRWHGPLLEHVYESYEASPDNSLNHEMRPASYELIKAGVVQWMPPRFNMQWSYYRNCYYRFLDEALPLPGWLPARWRGGLEDLRTRGCVRMAYENNVLLHFTGGSRDYRLL